jgi:hypothetical protein
MPSNAQSVTPYAKLLTVAKSNTDAIGTIGTIDVAFMY